MLAARITRIEERLAQHGINNYQIAYPEYLNFDHQLFATPREVGCRVMILLAIAYTIQDNSKKFGIVNWLKNENIWSYVSEKETIYLNGGTVSDDTLMALCWRIEAAYILAWSLNLVKDRPVPGQELSEEQISELIDSLPALGDNLGDFLDRLYFRSPEEIYDENIFYELTTTHYRDTLFAGRRSTADVHVPASFERHLALNWLRRFMNVRDWDLTDTSTL
ncbi:DUF4272 domain-containing protein [Chitinophaga pinensis]|uniref:DUF4272 domain-containing protein n=1 Tax=Chitinophaga pinensis (strain ATCC 43595 / DSM 2588 / LMG 13176 / NBRC 15968 / NCIMB 11800 / UQM 2034) TaxID=485918 RepID=A0A979G355_CHIPD|nr:DUF4272 domain-containing protein [Chitinophaga pinensis]ACU59921.1 hypothetical protein Cpin_2430 [Chitinophaga pinensis DSM 2588]